MRDMATASVTTGFAPTDKADVVDTVDLFVLLLFGYKSTTLVQEFNEWEYCYILTLVSGYAQLGFIFLARNMGCLLSMRCSSSQD